MLPNGKIRIVMSYDKIISPFLYQNIKRFTVIVTKTLINHNEGTEVKDKGGYGLE